MGSVSECMSVSASVSVYACMHPYAWPARISSGKGLHALRVARAHKHFEWQRPASTSRGKGPDVLRACMHTCIHAYMHALHTNTSLAINRLTDVRLRWEYRRWI